MLLSRHDFLKLSRDALKKSARPWAVQQLVSRRATLAPLFSSYLGYGACLDINPAALAALARDSMLLASLRRAVLEGNLELVRRGLVLFTFGNASGISRKDGLVVIKPSGVPYDKMKPVDLVVTDLDGKIVEGKLRPSSDLPTHLVLYKSFPNIGGVSHTHSEYATAWAQARRAIPCFGTTHADYFHGDVPVTDELKDSEISANYEENTGRAIVRTFHGRDYSSIPGVLVANHGPFTWGPNPGASAHNAVILESVARMAYFTLDINAQAQAIQRSLHDKHFLRKHGKDAYYGQPKEKK